MRSRRKEKSEVINLSAFKAYDIRGKIPEEINEDLVYQIGRAFAAFVKPKKSRWAATSASPATCSPRN